VASVQTWRPRESVNETGSPASSQTAHDSTYQPGPPAPFVAGPSRRMTACFATPSRSRTSRVLGRYFPWNGSHRVALPRELRPGLPSVRSPVASSGAPVLDPSLATRDNHRRGSEVKIPAPPLHRVHANESLVVWDRMASVLCTDEERSSSQHCWVAGLPKVRIPAGLPAAGRGSAERRLPHVPAR
jgi:hypothetical protein